MLFGIIIWTHAYTCDRINESGNACRKHRVAVAGVSAARRLQKNTGKILMKNKRKKDPFVDRRTGEDRRDSYDLDYFQEDGTERRSGKERRRKGERRDRCIPVSDWSSVCPDEDQDDNPNDDS